MQIKLSFLGAAQNVTGSQYLLEFNNHKVLIDSGLYQERQFKHRNWKPFQFNPVDLDFVLLTHAHLDHCGLLPKLTRDGFRGKIYCTNATADIIKIMLMDSAKLQEEDAVYKKRRHRREGRKGPYPEVPLYTVEDVEECLPLVSAVNYYESIKLTDNLSATFHDAGHVLGSSMITLKVKDNDEERTILFSGDVGRCDKPILQDPTFFNEADYMLVESTYGDRLHEGHDPIADELADIINATVKKGGNIVIPSFALERAQELLYYLNELLLANRIPHLVTFIDSPMAINITEVFENHPDLFDDEMMQLIRQRRSPFDFPSLNMTRTAEQSKAINHIKGSIMVIAGSGMCTGGRIKHHLVENISRKESTILFVGYQARGTLGRHITEGAKEVRILGQKHKIKARIAQIYGFSAHADRDELTKWVLSLNKPPRMIFIVHGEPEASQYFADHLGNKITSKIVLPEYKEQFILD